MVNKCLNFNQKHAQNEYKYNTTTQYDMYKYVNIYTM